MEKTKEDVFPVLQIFIQARTVSAYGKDSVESRLLKSFDKSKPDTNRFINDNRQLGFGYCFHIKKKTPKIDADKPPLTGANAHNQNNDNLI